MYCFSIMVKKDQMSNLVLGELIHFQGRQLCQLVSLSIQKGSSQKGKNLLQRDSAVHESKQEVIKIVSL